MNKYLIRLSICFLLFSSCKKEYLEKIDPTRVIAEGFYKDSAQITQAVYGVYSRFQPLILEQWTFNELPSDNTTIDFDPGNRFYHDRMEQLEYWNVLSVNPQLNATFDTYYSLLANANTALVKIDEASISEPARKQSKGELLFLRAYAYFNLVQYYGAVPLVLEPMSSPAESYNYIRNTETEVWTQIEKDLKEASELLPATYGAANKGRATKGAALSLIGKSYLTQKKFSEAVTSLKQVTTLGYSLLPTYAAVFDPVNKNHAESVFDIQFQGNNTLGEHSDFSYTFAPRLSKGIVTGYAAGTNRGWNTPTKDMINAYEPNDSRKAVSLKEGYTDAGVFKPVPYISKYNHAHTIVSRTNNNWPVLRYADVLLMLAEAINEAGTPTPEAFGYLNAVRTRAGLTSLSGLDKAAFRDAIAKERRVELAFENHRWFDLKRTKSPAELAAFLNAHGAREKASPTVGRGGVPFQAQDYIFEPHEALYPIPPNLIRLSSKITQNPGY